MKSKFLPVISIDILKLQDADNQVIYDLLVEPLHEELYKRQTFDFLDDLSEGQQLLLSYDYVRMQVEQGGFIQLIQNGYVGLLPTMPGWLQNIEDPEMAEVIDDALKVYVLNRELLNRQTTVEEFALLYQELKEFEGIDDRFRTQNAQTVDKMVHYAVKHINEFASFAS